MPIDTRFQPGDRIRIARTMHEVPATNAPSKATIAEGDEGQVIAINHDMQANTTTLQATVFVGTQFKGVIWGFPADAAEQIDGE